MKKECSHWKAERTCFSKSVFMLLIGFLHLGFLHVGNCYAGTLPACITFDGDTVGTAPSTGGTNQPSALDITGDGSITVESSSNGMNTKPVVLCAPGGEYLSVNYYFEPVAASGIVRVEATVSIDSYLSGYFLQTSVPTAVFSRFGISCDGTINDYAGTVVGTYTPNAPFRVRMDVDLDSMLWAATIDNETDGFGNDVTFENLAFCNDHSVLPELGAVHASLNAFGTQESTTLAYDDISITMVPEPATLFLFSLGSVLAKRKRT